jgi:hypothetical protein
MDARRAPVILLLIGRETMTGMTHTLISLGHAAARRCRDVAVACIAAVSRRAGFDEVEARITALSLRDQAAITGAVLVLLFGLSLLAAQFGPLGVALYLVAIVLLIR